MEYDEYKKLIQQQLIAAFYDLGYAMKFPVVSRKEINGAIESLETAIRLIKEFDDGK